MKQKKSKKFMPHRHYFKNYARRSNGCFVVATPLMFLTVYLFLFHFELDIVWMIAGQWSTAFMVFAFVYLFISQSRHSRHVAITTRHEEFSFLTLRFIIILPLVVLVFGEIQSKLDGVFMFSSLVCMLVLTLAFDKFELEILC